MAATKKNRKGSKSQQEKNIYIYISSIINGSANARRIVGFDTSDQGRAARRWQPPSLSTTNNIGSNRTVWVQPTSVHPTPTRIMNAVNNLLGRNSGGNKPQGDEDTLAYNQGGVSFEEEVVIIDPNAQLQEQLAATAISQQEFQQLVPTTGAAAGTGWIGVQAPPQQGAGGIRNPPQAPTEYYGLKTALRCLGHNMYDPEMIAAELKQQSEINGDQGKRAAFQDFLVYYTQVRVYLAMVGMQATVTMIHTPLVLLNVHV
jgi:hypothetical protein